MSCPAAVAAYCVALLQLRNLFILQDDDTQAIINNSTKVLHCEIPCALSMQRCIPTNIERHWELNRRKTWGRYFKRGRKETPANVKSASCLSTQPAIGRRSLCFQVCNSVCCGPAGESFFINVSCRRRSFRQCRQCRHASILPVFILRCDGWPAAEDNAIDACCFFCNPTILLVKDGNYPPIYYMHELGPPWPPDQTAPLLVCTLVQPIMLALLIVVLAGPLLVRQDRKSHRLKLDGKPQTTYHPPSSVRMYIRTPVPAVRRPVNGRPRGPGPVGA